MFFTIGQWTLEIEAGKNWRNQYNIIEKTPNNPILFKKWLTNNWNKLTKIFIPYLKKGNFTYAPELFQIVSYKYIIEPKKPPYFKIISNVYFEDTFNEGPNKMIFYIKKAGLLNYPDEFKIINKYTKK